MYDTRLARSPVRAQMRVARRCALAMHSGGRVGVSDWYAGDIDQGIVYWDTAVYAGGRHVLPVLRPLQGALCCARMTVVYAGSTRDASYGH